MSEQNEGKETKKWYLIYDAHGIARILNASIIPLSIIAVGAIWISLNIRSNRICTLSKQLKIDVPDNVLIPAIDSAVKNTSIRMLRESLLRILRLKLVERLRRPSSP